MNEMGGIDVSFITPTQSMGGQRFTILSQNTKHPRVGLTLHNKVVIVI